jgi:hypothetical protein
MPKPRPRPAIIGKNNCPRRLQRDLGVDQAAAEAILHLRSQVIELQTQLRRLSAELDTQHASQDARLASSREIYYEGVWIEVKFDK